MKHAKKTCKMHCCKLTNCFCSITSSSIGNKITSKLPTLLNLSTVNMSITYPSTFSSNEAQNNSVVQYAILQPNIKYHCTLVLYNISTINAHICCDLTASLKAAK